MTARAAPSIVSLSAESNAFFLRAEHWRALGSWKEDFVTPGAV
jgi:hypothetical protein